VAEEVRKLAEQTSQSSEEIAGLITGIVDTITTITTEIEEGARKTATDIEYTDRAKGSFQQVTTSTETTYEDILEIKSLADEAYRLSENLGSVLDGITGTAQSSAAFSEEVSASTTEQSRLTNDLLSAVNGLKEKTSSIEKYLNDFVDGAVMKEMNPAAIDKYFAVFREVVSEVNSQRLSLEQATSILREKNRLHPEFEIISITGLKGYVITASIDEFRKDKDYSIRPWFQEAAAGRDYCSKPYISNVTYTYGVTLAIPFRNLQGEIIGEVVGDLCLER
jgi:Methyl-accepting chemotaxis protein